MRITIFFQEILSVIATPFVLWYSLPPRAPVVIDFFKDYTMHVDGLGYVCNFAVFDFKRRRNANVSPVEAAAEENLIFSY